MYRIFQLILLGASSLVQFLNQSPASPAASSSLLGASGRAGCPGERCPRPLFQIRLTDPLGKLSHILEMDHFALVVHEQIQCKWGGRGRGRGPGLGARASVHTFLP